MSTVDVDVRTQTASSLDPELWVQLLAVPCVADTAGQRSTARAAYVLETIRCSHVQMCFQQQVNLLPIQEYKHGAYSIPCGIQVLHAMSTFRRDPAWCCMP